VKNTVSKKTLVLAVDRDNDYGVKAGVVTPVIGVEGCTAAAVALGAKDPEDSDVNGLFAAIKMYNEIKEDGRDAEIALICGDEKVGHRSDSKVIDELEAILDEIKPDRVMLVGDGAEDEYVYPIISSRVPIDSVKKVYVKQAPGLESTLYILSKMIRDPDKKRRFLSPFAVLLILLGMIFLVEGVIAYLSTHDASYIYGQTWSLVSIVLGTAIFMYAYDIVDLIVEKIHYGFKNIYSGNLTITFTILSIGLAAFGIVRGIYSVWGAQTYDLMYIALEFIYNAMWFFVFAAVLRDAGKALNNYITVKKVNRSFMTGTIIVMGLAFLMQGILDAVMNMLGYSLIDQLTIIVEITAGITVEVVASVLQTNFSRYFRPSTKGA
jgi:putative membrane protein